MDDGSLDQHIEDLVAEEARLLHSHENTGLSGTEHARFG